MNVLTQFISDNLALIGTIYAIGTIAATLSILRKP